MTTMTGPEFDLLHKYIERSRHYLEYGSGESTVYASAVKDIRKIVSVESSEQYVRDALLTIAGMVDAVKSGKLEIKIIDIGETKEWGMPVNGAKRHLWPNYPLSPFCGGQKYDVCFIDGRFRVASALCCILNSENEGLVIIHDFWNRPEYHILLRFLRIKERADTLGVFEVKKKLPVRKIQKLIAVYQYLPDDIGSAYRRRKKMKMWFLHGIKKIRAFKRNI